MRKKKVAKLPNIAYSPVFNSTRLPASEWLEIDSLFYLPLSETAIKFIKRVKEKRLKNVKNAEN